ncbi:MAG: hypothetical protein LBK06_03910 [Planctomycetaceae bacterium]|nr:hypothetical protein [Planctomycetaceae bacterium]
MLFIINSIYVEAVLKFKKLNTQAQQREAVVQGRSLSHYRLRYKTIVPCRAILKFNKRNMANAILRSVCSMVNPIVHTSCGITKTPANSIDNPNICQPYHS